VPSASSVVNYIAVPLDPKELARTDDLRRRLAVALRDGNGALDASVLAELVARLARLDELEHQFHRALERAKLDALKEFAYGAGHELNNPLANIATRAQTLLQEETDPERRKKLAAINSQAFRAHEMIADMMLFARPPHLTPARVNMQALVDAVLDKFSQQAVQRSVTLRRAGSNEPIFIQADATQLAVALRALVTNALEALSLDESKGRAGYVELSVSRSEDTRSEAAAGGSVTITVVDNGAGIPPDVRPHIFDPFYSGREAGRGLGLGLSKCWRIVTAHGGGIDVESTPGQGAKFSITLPANRE
jgi:signal transduction histidine kinase